MFTPKPRSLPDYLVWDRMSPKGLVLHKNGRALQRTACLRLRDLDAATAEMLKSTRARLAQGFRQLDSGFALHLDIHHRPVGGYFPEGDFPDPVSRLLDTERRAAFATTARHFETVLYVTLIYLLPQGMRTRLARLFLNDQETGEDAPARRQIAHFEQTWRKLVESLRGLSAGLEELDGAATLAYLHSRVSEREHPVRCPARVPVLTDLDERLTDVPVTGGLKPKVGDLYLGIITIKSWPDESVPDLMRVIADLPFEYRLVLRWLGLDRAESTAELGSLRQRWFRKHKSLITLVFEYLSGQEARLQDPDALNKTEDVELALMGVGDGLFAYGYLSFTLLVGDRSAQAVDEKAALVGARLNGAGFITLVESVNAVEAWIGSHPGNLWANIRRPLISCFTLADLCLVPTPWGGTASNPHLKGPPLLLAETPEGTPFRVDLHQESDVGHCFIPGPTGAGKSTLLAILGAQFLRYPEAQVFFLDVGGSCRAMTRALDGAFHRLGETGGLALQPLADIDRDSERAWAVDWLKGLLHLKGVRIDADLEGELAAALSSLASRPPEQRTLSLFSALVQPRAVRAALRPFTLEGHAGHLLDASGSRISERSVLAFDLAALERDEVLVPVLGYLFRHIERRLDGRPTLILVDEAWRALANSFFAERIDAWLRTLRKRNASVVFATQTLADIDASDLARILIDSCPTRIFLPNPRAGEAASAAVYERFGLNPRQIELIATARPKRQYFFQATRGSRLFELALSPAALALSGAGSPADHRLMDQIPDALQGADFARAFLDAKGIPFPTAPFDPLAEEVTHD